MEELDYFSLQRRKSQAISVYSSSIQQVMKFKLRSEQRKNIAGSGGEEEGHFIQHTVTNRANQMSSRSPRTGHEGKLPLPLYVYCVAMISELRGKS